MHVVVRDEGPGIRPENLTHVLDRYWQTERKVADMILSRAAPGPSACSAVTMPGTRVTRSVRASSLGSPFSDARRACGSTSSWAPDFATSAARVVGGVRNAVLAMGAPDLAPVCDHMTVPYTKGRFPSEAQKARAQKAEVDCVAALPARQTWVRFAP